MPDFPPPIHPLEKVEPVSYIIFKRDNLIYAKNGRTGEIEFQDEDAATVIQQAINALPDGGGKIFIRIFPDKPVTKKPAETRMGSGKGSPDHWVAVIRPGRMLFEISGIRENLAKEAMHLASYKLPIATRFVVKETAKEKEEAKS